MDRDAGPAPLPDAELLARYRAAGASKDRLRSQIEAAEAAWLDRPSPEARDRLRLLRDAFRAAADLEGRLEVELRCRLQAPLAAARRAAGLSLGEVARRSGLPRNAVSDYESGRFGIRLDDALRLWAALGLELPEGWETLG